MLLRHRQLASATLPVAAVPAATSATPSGAAAAPAAVQAAATALVALHNQRFAVQALLAQRPALLTTQAEYALTQRFSAGAAAALQQRLADWVDDPAVDLNQATTDWVTAAQRQQVWQSLSLDAGDSLAAIDRQLAANPGAAAAARETALLQRLAAVDVANPRLGRLVAAAAQDPAAHQPLAW
jgi:hypothetical protein